MRKRPELARSGGAFTPLMVLFLSSFIDLTHEKYFGLWKLV
ncbi:hypothetical protein HMPREF1502_0572 [Klebsiella sp. AS10]|nr:hypothetical protein HMPREF1502_0572 [Klebsiella sp. AS10]